MVVGGCVLRTLETWRRCCIDRICGNGYDRRLHAALSALSSLWRKKTLGSGSHRRRRLGFGSMLGRPAADVYLHASQPAAVAARTRHRTRHKKRPAEAPALDTTAFSPVAESARRIRARTRAGVSVRCRPDDGDGVRQYAVAGSAPHPPAGAAASAGLFGAGASQPQRRATLSLSVRHFALIRDAVLH